jgi:uncharacterized protein (DUF849 family)
VSLDDPVIITCAISGALANREQCPAIPYTPAEYAAEARPLAPLVDMGLLEAPLHASFVIGVVGGVPPSARNVAAMADNLPIGAHWGVIGISRAQWMLVAAALTLGGSVRVGLEDNLYLPDGTMASSNGDLVAKARQMTLDVGRRPATVAEARALLGIPSRPARTQALPA